VALPGCRSGPDRGLPGEPSQVGRGGSSNSARSRQTVSVGAPGRGQPIDLNPQIGTWYLLRLETSGAPSATYHLENPSGARLRLDPAYRSGIVIERAGSELDARFLCELWPAGTATPLADARSSRLAYAPLCGGRLFLRNPVEGHRTPKERVVDLLRDHVWHGEEITVLVRDLFFRDAYLATSSLVSAPVKPPAEFQSGPVPPLVSPAALDRLLVPVNLGIDLDGEAAGAWRRPLVSGAGQPGDLRHHPRPDLVSPEVIEAQKGRVSALDPVESAALVYLVAFDLGQFDLGFRLGTDHPHCQLVRCGQLPSATMPWKGPDVGAIEPLVRTGC
jgi:hypothetical protein